ncbi:MAG: uracil-DNA glycosylase [Proteobacteria bacterium]|nr:uracil-DNA glycosylase [Pseudomonadota bacterium]
MSVIASETASPRQILEFLLAAGVDLPLGDEPVNRLAPPPVPAAPVREATETKPQIVAAPALAGPEEAAANAREIAKAALDLEALRAALDAFDGCALKKTASRLVFADGNPKARIMIIGEAPGRDEDEIGRPFVGRAGQLLDKMLAAIGLDRTSVYIANTVPWRPPGNRTPTPQEIAVCMPFILRQIELAAPDILVTMGAPSSQTLLNQKDGILRLRGRWLSFTVGGRAIPAIPMLHPAYLLRSPAQKNLAWRDLRALKAKLEALGPRQA